MRTFAIIVQNYEVDIAGNILSKLPEESKVMIFVPETDTTSDFDEKISKIGNIHAETRFYPADLRIHYSKLKNFVTRTLIDEKVPGFVHILEECIKIDNSPDAFLSEIEKMMDVFNLKSWFNTACDGCNYVYSKYNPRLYIQIDDDEASKVYPKTIAWCSNANTAWICYNMDNTGFEDLRFEEKFDFPMYYIIEFLARRRNTKKPGELEYMNYYPSIPEELGVFSVVQMPETRHFEKTEIENEGKIFTEMHVNNTPDQSLDLLMEDMRNAILKK